MTVQKNETLKQTYEFLNRTNHSTTALYKVYKHYLQNVSQAACSSINSADPVLNFEKKIQVF